VPVAFARSGRPRPPGELRRRIVGRMGIVKVDPEKKRLSGAGGWRLAGDWPVSPKLARLTCERRRIQPGECVIDDHRRAPLRFQPLGGIRIARTFTPDLRRCSDKAPFAEARVRGTAHNAVVDAASRQSVGSDKIRGLVAARQMIGTRFER